MGSIICSKMNILAVRAKLVKEQKNIRLRMFTCLWTKIFILEQMSHYWNEISHGYIWSILTYFYYFQYVTIQKMTINYVQLKILPHLSVTLLVLQSTVSVSYTLMVDYSTTQTCSDPGTNVTDEFSTKDRIFPPISPNWFFLLF